MILKGVTRLPRLYCRTSDFFKEGGKPSGDRTLVAWADGLVAEVPENAEENKVEIVLHPLFLLFSAFLSALSDKNSKTPPPKMWVTARADMEVPQEGTARGNAI
jgi:hypothetical protein